MKIVHICISVPFIDSWGYQENLLPRYLQEAGTQNYIIASANDFPTYLKQEMIEQIKAKGNSYTLDEIEIRRIPTKKYTTSLAVTFGLKETLEQIRPDAIFHHNLNCTSMLIAARYARRHGIKMVVDNHADTINMTKNKAWALIYYKILTGLAVKYCKKDIVKAYGVTHARCAFIHDFFGLAWQKIDFLPIGADVKLSENILEKNELRKKYGIGINDFVVVTGGKMGKGKGTDNLIMSVENLVHEFPSLKLVLFGKFEDVDTEEQARSCKLTTIYGWCDRVKTLELLKLADVACWPIHHTTLIEDAVSVCTPIINRRTGTTEHLIDGNGIWTEDGSVESLKNALSGMLHMDEKERETMTEACRRKRDQISYVTVSNKLINDIL